MPDTLSYLILGLVVIFGILGLFSAYMMLSFRNAIKDIQTIRQLADEE